MPDNILRLQPQSAPARGKGKTAPTPASPAEPVAAPGATEATAATPDSAVAAFMINKQSAVPLHVQLKEQIRYAVMSGLYQPGGALPSIRELTAQLGIHRNTVHRVYLELQAGGLLVSRPGKGVFVNEGWSDAVSSRELNAVDGLMGRYFQEAGALGISAITLGKLIQQRAPAYDARYPSVAFVECTAHQSQECARDLAQAFGISVQHMLLDDLRRAPQAVPEHVQHLVTSVFHYDEVKLLAQRLKRRVHPIAYDLHPATRKLLREIAPGRRLGFICHDANTEEVIGAQIQERVPEGVLVGCANLEAPKHALELLRQVDTVMLTPPASAFCIQHCDASHELLELHFALNAPSVDKVTRTILFQP
ncbi:MAG TPA: GntR family transcriptional regulator [bacterium]|nr:GntR family transcriptional regulator [bacterium]